MNKQQEAVFRKALNSDNLYAIANIANIFNELGEGKRAQALTQRIYSMAYGFGVDYAMVQQKLNDLGASPKLDVDGSWGPKSKVALIAFQKSKGLAPADGTPGPMTLSALGISGANEVASSTMGHTMPSNNSSDAKAYAVGQKAGKEMGLTEQEIQYVVSVARGEGGYGAGWAHPSAKTLELSKQFGLTGYEGADSNNWGACQGSGNAGSFPHVDLGWMAPDADGKPTKTHWSGKGAKVWGPYVANYRKYATPEDGFKDMVRIILGGGKRKAVGAQELKAAVAKGHLHDAVFAQHANGYFELAPEKYLSAVTSNYKKIMNGVGWPKVLDEFGVITTKVVEAGKAAEQVGERAVKAVEQISEKAIAKVEEAGKAAGKAATSGTGIAIMVALAAIGIFLFRKPLGLIHA